MTVETIPCHVNDLEVSRGVIRALEELLDLSISAHVLDKT
jgi:hypothetical protein